MKIKIVAVGARMPTWVSQAYEEYSRRLPHQVQVELVEIAAKKRGKNADTTRILEQEAELIQAAVPSDYQAIALDRIGRVITTDELAQSLRDWVDQSQNIALLIGGPEGLAPSLLKSIRLRWSLSALTFAHPVVRVMLAEQLYRAWSINAGLPYHRGDK